MEYVRTVIAIAFELCEDSKIIMPDCLLWPWDAKVLEQLD